MWSILIPVDAATEDELVAELWERGTLGIIEETAGMRAFFDGSVDSNQIVTLPGLDGCEVREESIGTAPTFEREGWDPILIGEQFFVAPPWITERGPASRMRLEMDSDTAFGTGRHETTQICIEAMEQRLRPEQVVLDVGCGSGILSAAARLLGAQKIYSCDIHEDAVATARRHVSSPLFIGSADAMAADSVDLVLANISAVVLDRLAGNLKRVIKPTGCLILSGFVHGRVPKLYRPQQVLERGDWLCWICGPDDIPTMSGQDAAEGLSHKTEWWL